MDQQLTRADVDPKYTWDLTRVYASDADWEKACEKVQAAAQEISAMAGTLSGGREAVLAVLRAYFTMQEELGGVFGYAAMKHNEDMANPTYTAMYGRSAVVGNDAHEKVSFLEPELLELPEEELRAMAADPAFADYDAYLTSVLHEKQHTLCREGEKLLSLAEAVTGNPKANYEMLTDADMVFGTTRGENGTRIPLTDEGLLPLLRSRDRAVRKSAYVNVMGAYKKLGNAITSIYEGRVKADIFEAKARGYARSRESYLYPDSVDESVYDNLVESIHGGVSTLAEYLHIRQELLGVPKLHMYDLYAQSEGGFDFPVDIEEAFGIFLEAVRPMGEDYVRDASRALPERWIDVYETKNKRGGAYSMSAAYWATPYMLLNHKKNYGGLSTLCHEMGHSMHSFYSKIAQPFPKARYTIFVAEVASTTNEILLNEYMRKRYAGNREAQLALLGELLEKFRTTVFRQTMFAEFEHKAHLMAEAGQPLTAENLCAMYYDLNKLYYGKACKVDREVANEWMRIPHFYTPYYVYKYATGFCAAVALARGILSGDPQKVADYRRFLTLGGSLPPIEELKVAGVDMSTPQPVCEALDYFAELVMEYREMASAEA